MLVRTLSTTAIAASLLLLPTSAPRAQMVHDHGAMPPGAQVGTVNFSISCKPGSQAAVTRGERVTRRIKHRS